ncbi:hypothetical protein MIMGU_mgv1a026034mg, partial [Erythranthe guttata]
HERLSTKHVQNLGNTLLEILSEAWGLETDRLKNTHIIRSRIPHDSSTRRSCQRPPSIVSRSMGWYQPIRGGLVINIGDLLQLVSNGRFLSNEHRAITSCVGPRISVACFISGNINNWNKIYGPIKEMISQENPAMYRDIVLGEYISRFFKAGLDDYRGLDYYKV